MPRLLIVAHAPLASALARVGAHAFPERSALLRAVDVTPDMTPEEVLERVATLLPASNEGEMLVLADVFGATPCNAAVRMADGARIRVVAGVNVPMLWRVLCYADETLDVLVARALAGATQGVLQAGASRPQQQAHGAGHEDAKEQGHHQQ